MPKKHDVSAANVTIIKCKWTETINDIYKNSKVRNDTEEQKKWNNCYLSKTRKRSKVCLMEQKNIRWVWIKYYAPVLQEDILFKGQIIII